MTAMSRGDEKFGEKRLAEVLTGSASLSVDEIAYRIVQAVIAFVSGSAGRLLSAAISEET